MPRRYTLGKRGEAKEATRARIVEVTLRLYRELGVTATTVPAIARAADVAPATVRNHFPTPADLADATAEALLRELRMPDASIFTGRRSMAERVDRLLDELVAFFERGTIWWQIREADRVAGDTWAAPERRYEERLAGLIAEAIAPLDDDPAVVSIVGASLVQAYFAGRASGRSPDESKELVRSLLMPWLDGRLRDRMGGGGAPDRRGRPNRRSMQPSRHDQP